MPDHEYPTPANAFDPDYLNQLAQHDDPVTAGEAVTGGFWRVVPLDDERFGLFRMWESPEDGDKPFGTLTDRGRWSWPARSRCGGAERRSGSLLLPLL